METSPDSLIQIFIRLVLILGPIYDIEKENWRILTNKEIYAMVKTHYTETIRLNRLHWFGHVQRMEDNRIPKKNYYMNLETMGLRSGPRNRWQDEVKAGWETRRKRVEGQGI